MNLHRMFWGLFLVVITPMTLLGGFSFGFIWGWTWYLPALPAAGLWLGVMAIFVMIARMDALRDQNEIVERWGRMIAASAVEPMITVDQQRALTLAEELFGLGDQLQTIYDLMLGETIASVDLTERLASQGPFHMRVPVLTVTTRTGKVVEFLPFRKMSTAPWVFIAEKTRPSRLSWEV